MIIITNFVVVASVGIKGVVCIWSMYAFYTKLIKQESCSKKKKKKKYKDVPVLSKGR